MLVIGATHKILSRSKATELGLLASKYSSNMKAVNSKALDVNGIANLNL